MPTAFFLSLVACKPSSSASFFSFSKSWNKSQEVRLLGGGNPNTTLLAIANAHSATGQGGSCLRSQLVIREDLDVVSVQFRVLGESSVLVQADAPTVLHFNLNSGMDSGGTLVLNLQLNKVRRGPVGWLFWALSAAVVGQGQQLHLFCLCRPPYTWTMPLFWPA